MSLNQSKKRIMSAWTPLNNEDANRKIFEERRELLNKWFEKWSDSQRRRILQDLLLKCKLKQLEFTGQILNKKKPVHHKDFTTHLPRVLSIYIFSYLDPRSLSRCAQVCWHWRNISELDQLWVTKCVRYGWTLPFTPSPFEVGVWKRFYIENVTQLHVTKPKELPKSLFSEMERLQLNGSVTPRLRTTPRPGSAASKSSTGAPRPWRGSDPVPKDTWRNNYLENDDETERVRKLRMKGALYGSSSKMSDMINRSKTKINTGVHQPIFTAEELQQQRINRSHSAHQLYDTSSGNERPAWAQPTSDTPTPDTPTPDTPTPDTPAPHTRKPSQGRHARTASNGNTNGVTTAAATRHKNGNATTTPPQQLNKTYPAATANGVASHKISPATPKLQPRNKNANGKKTANTASANKQGDTTAQESTWSFPPPDDEYDSEIDFY